MIDSEDFIFGPNINGGLEPKFQAQLLILSQDKVDGENYNQYFLDGITNCFLTPIKKWAEGCLIEAKSKSAIGRYKKIVKDVSKLEKGMTKAQVDFIFGRAVIMDPFHNNRWDYFNSITVGEEAITERKLSIFFNDDGVVDSWVLEKLSDN